MRRSYQKQHHLGTNILGSARGKAPRRARSGARLPAWRSRQRAAYRGMWRRGLRRDKGVAVACDKPPALPADFRCQPSVESRLSAKPQAAAFPFVKRFAQPINAPCALLRTDLALLHSRYCATSACLSHPGAIVAQLRRDRIGRLIGHAVGPYRGAASSSPALPCLAGWCRDHRAPPTFVRVNFIFANDLPSRMPS